MDHMLLLQVFGLLGLRIRYWIIIVVVVVLLLIVASMARSRGRSV